MKHQLLWQKANYQHLLGALERIRELLEAYMASEANKLDLISSNPPIIPENSTLYNISSIFNLSPFELDILLLCLGMELDPYFSSLCAKIQQNQGRKYPTLGLAVSVLPGGTWNVLSAQNPLHHWNLIDIEPSLILTQSPIRLDRHILCYLLGEPSEDEQLTGIVKPFSLSSSITLPPSHQKLVDLILSSWSQAPINSTGLIIQLCGTEKTAKQAIAAAACASFGCRLHVMSLATISRRPQEIKHLIARWEREALLTNSALLLDCDSNISDSLQEFAMAEIIAEINTLLIISSITRVSNHQHPIITLDVPQPTYREQLDIWESHLGSTATELNEPVKQLVSQFNLSPAAIESACYQLKINQSQEIYSDHNQLWDLCRFQARPRLDDLAQRIESSATWEDLIIPERECQILKEMAA